MLAPASSALPAADRAGRAGGDVSRGRRVGVFLYVLFAGFAMFAAPALFFQLGFGGGYEGANLAVVGVVQLVLVGLVVASGLRMLRRTPERIGWSFRRAGRDALLGAGVALAWAAVQFAWLFPATGGAGRADIAAILEMVDGRWANVLWYLPLGVLGGGVAEEVYNRGFIITALRELLGNTRGATVGAGLFSALFFAAGHLPSTALAWFDILVPSLAYVVLFLYTRRLVAPMVAHALWNALAVVGIQLLYG